MSSNSRRHSVCFRTLLSTAKFAAPVTNLMPYAVGQFCPVKCSSGRIGASLRCRKSDSGLADETQLKPRPSHLTHAVGSFASRARSFTGRTTGVTYINITFTAGNEYNAGTWPATAGAHCLASISHMVVCQSLWSLSRWTDKRPLSRYK